MRRCRACGLVFNAGPAHLRTKHVECPARMSDESIVEAFLATFPSQVVPVVVRMQSYSPRCHQLLVVRAGEVVWKGPERKSRGAALRAAFAELHRSFESEEERRIA